MIFEENEIVIANEKFKNAMPYRSGERCKVVEKLHSSIQFQYEVEFDDGVKCKAKESELNKLSKEDVRFMDFIFTGNEVAYRPINETVKIVKVDYLLKVAEIRDSQNTEQVVSFDSLKGLDKESDSLKVIENDVLQVEMDELGKLIEIFLGHYRNQDNTYTVPKQLLVNMFKFNLKEV